MVLKLSAPWTLVFDKLENVKSGQSFLNSWKIRLMNRIFVFELFFLHCKIKMKLILMGKEVKSHLVVSVDAIANMVILCSKIVLRL